MAEMQRQLDMKGTERLALVGATGSGKTFLAERLVYPLQRLIVCDPKGTLYGKWGLEPWGRDTAYRLRRGEAVRAWIPGPGPGDHDVIAYWEQFFAVAYEAGGVTVYIDEMYGVVPVRKNPGATLQALYTRGRELGIGVWAASQRPSWVPIFTLSEAEWLIQFELRWPADRKRMGEIMGPMGLTNPPAEFSFYVFNNGWRNPLLVRKVDGTPLYYEQEAPGFWERLRLWWAKL